MYMILIGSIYSEDFGSTDLQNNNLLCYIILLFLYYPKKFCYLCFWTGFCAVS